MMNAAMLREARKIDIVQRPIPKAGKGEVVVEVSLCGICGSDIHGYLSGVMIPPGTVMGHESVGKVVELGNGVQDWSVGDRVAIKPLAECGECYYCLRGQYSLCPEGFQRCIGISPAVDGAFARYVRISYPGRMLFRLPEEVTFEAGVLVEPLATSLHAIRTSGFRLGDTTVVIGAGTIGLGVIQFLRLGGAGKIVVVEISEAKRQLACAMGADLALDPAAEGEGLREKVLEATQGLGAHFVFECAGVPQAVRASYTLVRGGGQVLLVGIADTDVSIQPLLLALGEVGLKATLGYWDEFPLALDFLRKGLIDTSGMVSRTIPLAEVSEGFNEALSNKDLVKVVVRP
jgi:2-desacetyl-2-hydroxyethyl bacteriochlorophyllide A dehydrogenase